MATSSIKSGEKQLNSPFRVMVNFRVSSRARADFFQVFQGQIRGCYGLMGGVVKSGEKK